MRCACGERESCKANTVGLQDKAGAAKWLGRAPFHSKAEAAKRKSLPRGTEPVRRERQKWKT